MPIVQRAASVLFLVSALVAAALAKSTLDLLLAAVVGGFAVVGDGLATLIAGQRRTIALMSAARPAPAPEAAAAPAETEEPTAARAGPWICGDCRAPKANPGGRCAACGATFAVRSA